MRELRASLRGGQLIVRKLRAALLSVTFTVMDTVVYSSKELRYSHSNFDIVPF